MMKIDENVLACDHQSPQRGMKSHRRGSRRLEAIRRVLLAFLVLGFASACDRTLSFSWTGRADTDLAFSEFFHADHTVFVRFMPQYPNAYHGPVVAENGTGTYALGQGDYSEGADGTKVYAAVGSTRLMWNVNLQQGKWHTLAMTADRGAANTTYTVFLDGAPLDPPFSVSNSHWQLPAGTLRLGKRTDGVTTIGNDAQFYGLIDDLAVFSDDLSPSEIQALTAGSYDFDGNEADLVAAYTFDDGASGPKLGRSYQVAGAASKRMSTDNHFDSDSSAFSLPTAHATMHLPFEPGEEWYVIQGYDEAGGSHKGYASFCWDFMLAGVPQQDQYPNGAGGAPFYAVASGEVVTEDDVRTSGQSPSNIVEIEHAPGEIAGYLHLEQNSATVAKGNHVLRGSQVGLVGDVGASVGANHLHLAVTDAPDGTSGFVTYPVAFTNYEVKQPNGSWKLVKRGVPEDGQVIRRPAPANLPYKVTGVWRPSTQGEIQLYGAKYDDYRARYDELWPQGWRLKLLEVHVRDGVPRYTAVWHPSTSAEIQVYDWSYDDYRAKYDSLWEKGWRLHVLQAYVVDGRVRYTAVWRPSTEGEIQVYGWTYNDYRAYYDQIWQEGWRLKIIQPYVVDGQVRYTAVWRPSTEGEIQVYGWSYSAFRAKYDQLWKKGWRIEILETYREAGQTRYVGVWRPGTSGELQVYEWSYPDYRSFYDDIWPDGWRLHLLDVY